MDVSDPWGLNSYSESAPGCPCIVIMPLPLFIDFLQDIFTAFNISVPRVWDDFLALAQRMNGTDFNAGGCMGAHRREHVPAACSAFCNLHAIPY